MSTAATATAPASSSTSEHGSPAASSPPAAAVCLVPFSWWATVREEATEGGVRYAATAAASPSYYGLRLLHCFLHPDLVLRLERGECNGAGGGAGGRSYALVPADELSRVLARQNFSLALHNKHSFAGDSAGAYPLVFRISVREPNILTVKISKKDNPVENYKRANKIFSIYSQPVHVWDFSGQTNLILMNEWNRPHHDCCHSDQENLLEVQVYAMSDSLTSKIGGTNKEYAEQSSGDVHDANAELSYGGFGRSDLTGLIGMENLGNTCFMNSSIQCLAHTSKLVDYFLGDYDRDINRTNPLGLNGELALAFGELLRKLWNNEKKPVSPYHFKAKVACFAPQFSGFNQHDSQELLAFLLDGLHEDLNKVKCKPYEEAKDASGRPDKEVADEYWSNHLARNDSIIVDICHSNQVPKIRRHDDVRPIHLVRKRYANPHKFAAGCCQHLCVLGLGSGGLHAADFPPWRNRFPHRIVTVADNGGRSAVAEEAVADGVPRAVTPAIPDEERHNEPLNSACSFDGSTDGDAADPTPQLMPPPTDPTLQQRRREEEEETEDNLATHEEAYLEQTVLQHPSEATKELLPSPTNDSDEDLEGRDDSTDGNRAKPMPQPLIPIAATRHARLPRGPAATSFASAPG
ncbi:hypothetical protein GUJ93_ZPchr0016g2503 [Zizania palustris]|uniref:USP domain-containing protein n=1 Tax=Zizania palustris TaxID=103762 RepID=A0A8J5SZ19_ZIZPA|nr:hypothetical protein GUJ93_ZPchr0016g2503 [Zizania palustris]